MLYIKNLIKNGLSIKIFFLLFVCIFLQNSTHQASAQVCSGKEECEKRIREYEEKLKEVRTEKTNLSSQIKLINTKIQLSEAKIQTTQHSIETTQEEITQIGEKIDNLNTTLDFLSAVLVQKIVEGYKNRDASFFDVFFSEKSSSLTHQLKYIQTVQENDRKIAVRTQQVKVNFTEQKELREEKKQELEKLEQTLEVQKVDFDNQKKAKQQFLIDTQNDETKYQELLARARAEFAAIQGIVEGKGKETMLREVKKGDQIATVISGKSCNSSGTHLHFIVQENNTVINPFNKLKPVDHVNNSIGDSFSPSGSWDWPIPPVIEFHQGYGNTWFVQNYGWYSFHNGIDISGSSNSVSAVEDGTLYRGSYAGFNGCTLPYVKVIHKDNNISTLYLHVYAN